jgi:hypothetical protein
MSRPRGMLTYSTRRPRIDNFFQNNMAGTEIWERMGLIKIGDLSPTERCV